MANFNKGEKMNTVANQLHRQSIVIDGLNASYFKDEEVLRRLHEGGVTAVNATIAAWHNCDETMQMLDDIQAIIEANGSYLMQVKTCRDIETAKKAGKVGLILGFQDTAPIEDRIELLEAYHRRGVRIIQLTYNTHNRVGSGCLEPLDEGITTFGKEVIHEMNRLGLLIDLSHCGPRTTRDGIALSKKPVAITHTDPAALVRQPRNKSDEILLALKEKGGVVGAMVFPLTLTGKPKATLEDYLNIIDYFVNLLGIDNVGLGPDFMEKMPAEIRKQALRDIPWTALFKVLRVRPVKNLESVTQLPNVTAGLVRRGYAEQDVKKIIGLNWLRLYGEVWEN